MAASPAEAHSVDAGEILSACRRETGRVPLLVAGAEVELAAAIEAGRAARDACDGVNR